MMLTRQHQPATPSFDEGVIAAHTRHAGTRNVGNGERAASLLAASALLAAGATRRTGVGKCGFLIGGSYLLVRGISGFCPLYRAVGLQTTKAAPPTKGRSAAMEAVPDIVEAITIGAPPETIMVALQDPQIFPQLWQPFATVTLVAEGRYRWQVHLPLGQALHWETQMTEVQPGERISWGTLPNAALSSTGEARLREAPGQRGTEVRVRFAFTPPLGPLGAAFTRGTHFMPNLIARKALYRLKSSIESGEIATTTPQPAGRHHGSAK